MSFNFKYEDKNEQKCTDWQLKHTLLVDFECNGLLQQETKLPIACPTVKLCLSGWSHSLQYEIQL